MAKTIITSADFPITEKQPNVNVCFTAPPSLADRIKQSADGCGVKVSEFLRVAVKAYMDDLEAAS